MKRTSLFRWDHFHRAIFLLLISGFSELRHSYGIGSTVAQNSNTFRPNQPPMFLPGGDLSKFSIPEDTPVGSVVYRLKGSDPENGELTYSISGEYFRVNKKSGDLTLIKAMDREVEPKIDAIISLTDDGNGLEPTTVSLRREIYIQDRNDNPPIFLRRPYSFKVSERTRVGATVFSEIPITDADFGPNAQVSLTCDTVETPEACKTFKVEVQKVGEGKFVGILSLEIPLDYETHNSYPMTLIATDGVNTAKAFVAISVLDVQDQSPKFYGGPYVFKVKENSAPGTKVGEISVQDGDIGNPRNLQLRLIDEAENKYFRLTNAERDMFTGTYTALVETTNYTLDAEDEFIRENLGVYELILEAREIPLHAEDTEPTLITRTGVAVIIEDVDDHLPAFIPPQFTRILRIPYNPEESWMFPDFRVEVEDSDVDPHHSKFSLKLDWNIEDSPHDIDDVFAFVTPSNDDPTIQSKGIITLEVLNISKLEPGQMIDLQIGAVQNGHIVSNLNVPIEVAPGPKIIPIFSQNVYRVALPEDLGEGELVAKITAKNHNEIPGIKYSLIGIGADKFDMNEDTGEIKCKAKCLDYERNQHNFFLIKAKAGEKVDDEVPVLFYLDTIERNDNYPEFEKVPGLGTHTPNGYLVRRAVPDGTSIFDPPFVVRASDPDVNDTIAYTLQDHSVRESGIFIDEHTGELGLEKGLKWSEAGEHRLTVTATDSTGKATHQSVLIVVQAIPNIPPSFPYKVQHVEVPETLEKGAQIFTVKAHDPDGQDSQIRYSIESQTTQDLFSMEESTGVLRLNGQLDYEEKQRIYPIKIRAQDEGKPPETAQVYVEVHVTDENDELPKFSEKQYVVEMSESSKPDLIVMTLKAGDKDDNAFLEYSISCPCQVWDASGSMGSSADAESYFKNLRVDPESGEIVLVDTFEHKKTAVLEFQAHVQDNNGIKLQSDTAAVTLYVTAAERTKPIFGHPWTTGNPWINLTIPEDLDNGTTVVTLNAWDYIESLPITDFRIIESDSEIFQLNGSQLIVNYDGDSQLDYETQDSYIVTVKGIAAHGAESICNLGIQISDVNDNAPTFTKPEYKGKVLENSGYPTPIVTVEAVDLDGSPGYGSVRYALTGPQSHLFTIDELAGVVQVAPGAEIDREKDESHLITVVAKDTPSGGPFQLTATAQLHILVQDENDNDPVCKIHEFLVPENAPVGTAVGNISCVDPDENPKLTFQMRDETHLSLFNVDKDTGKIAVARVLRGRGRSAPYIMTVIVEDGKERTVNLAVPIKIANVIPNDGKPKFVNENFTVTISEASMRGTPVLYVKGEDTDSFDNGEGRLHYHLMKQFSPCQSLINGGNISRVDDVDLFRLDEITGVLSLKDSVDREKTPCFSVLVSVEDSGIPPQSETQFFEIHLSDVDDSLPYLPKEVRSLQLTLNESTKVGSIVYNFTGEDRDIHPNNLITFEISGGGKDLFKVIPTGDQSAKLILNADLRGMEHEALTVVIKCHPKHKKLSVPECSSKVNIKLNRDLKGAVNYLGKTKYYEMILGVASGTSVGNLIGNVGMPKKFKSSVQMFHPMGGHSSSPYNVTDLIRIDDDTGDIFVWDNLERYSNGHLRVQMNDDSGTMKKNLKVFIEPNEQLLSSDMVEFPKLQKFMDEVDGFLNSPEEKTGIKRGHFHILTFDQTNSYDGKTKVCFQLLENENMISQEKALQILDNGDLQDIFLKYSFEDIQKGCPTRPRLPARLALTAGTSRFWVERSLIGIAAVVAIATISAILILCLISRNRVKDGH
ncbi:unnamed protein product [Orchesella dallaii]|uniref:Cadherin domain-containing protein n=1 Tax=Orchesella dallaii TaxID=48710 RepID=A0ABP1QLU8_9HEXA